MNGLKKNRIYWQFLFLIGLLMQVVVSGSSRAEEYYVGIDVATELIGIEDTDYSYNDIATLENEGVYKPSISIRTNARYLKDSNWGYHFQYDFAAFDLDKQSAFNSQELLDLGTSIDGYSVYVVPVIYYHFNKYDHDKWNYKAGVGVGLSYVNMNGDFIITDPSHPESGQLKNVSVDDFGFSVGVYFEASFGPHVILGQNYSPVVSDGQYEYQQHNIIISYRYRFYINR